MARAKYKTSHAFATASAPWLVRCLKAGRYFISFPLIATEPYHTRPNSHKCPQRPFKCSLGPTGGAQLYK